VSHDVRYIYVIVFPSHKVQL